MFPIMVYPPGYQAEDLVRIYLGLQNKPETQIKFDHIENGQ